MSKRGKFGALAGAFLLTFAAASVAFAAPPTYDIAVTKTASPTSLPEGGGTVTFTVTVKNTGTADFHGLSVTDPKCTLAGPEVSASDKFEVDATLTYTCSYNVTATQTNTATAYACHDSGNCNSGNALVTKSASVTVTVAAVVPAPTPTPTPKKIVAPITSTTSLVSSSSDGAWLLIIALGVLLASVVILTPRGKKSES